MFSVITLLRWPQLITVMPKFFAIVGQEKLIWHNLFLHTEATNRLICILLKA